MESTRRNICLAQGFIRWAIIFLFLSFAWEYWRWGGPIRSILWDENFFSPIITSFGWEWSEWVTSLAVESWMTMSSKVIAFLFLGAAITAYFYPKNKRIARPFLYFNVVMLFLQVLIKTKTHFWQIGQFLELSLQWSSPIFLILAFSAKNNLEQLKNFMKIAIALTFIGHGLYAIGFHPVPGHFSGMMMSGFNMSNATALSCLYIVGWLDIIAAIALFTPNFKWMKWALYYIIIWGFLTAVARIWSYLPFYNIEQLANQWLAESSVRWIHFMIPIALYYLLKPESKSDSVS